MDYKGSIKYNNQELKFIANEHNVRILDSHLVKDKAKIYACIKLLRKTLEEKHSLVYSRSVSSWVHEWYAHNWLYKNNIKTSSTKDVDINEDEKILRRIGYFLISAFLR